ncbi:hypothetical protein T484DRAFT_1832141 [Baffinella frigidus]|nr:hypothetical protein T484DRAFT_1832141 [Cryptophyta sp. CCMP2293]
MGRMMLLAVLAVACIQVALAGPVLTTPNRALAEGRDPTSAEPRMHSQQVAAKSEGEGVEFALRGGSGRKLVMVAKAAEVEATKAPAVMLSFKDPATKKTLAAVVTVGYAAIWLFFFLTHDSGEVSE